ncbi:MAG: efflux RND transporter periplasmic adaptor subunit [Ignavibacteriae bacterium]|nr:efflux RND transporter periplasmic adaptor subunit [Ignavibacteriota bacterium]
MKPNLRWTLYFVLSTLYFVSCSKDDTNNISASGTIEATQITISSKVAGEIKRLFFDEGTHVEEGDTLASINHEMADIELRQAEANALAAEAQYRLIVKGARQEDLLQAEANLQNARSDYTRVEDLFQQKSSTQKQFDDAKMRFVVAEQAYEKLKRGARSEEIETAMARRDQARAAVDGIKKKIQDATVVSPTDGIITQKVMEEGEVVAPGATLFRIAKLTEVHLMIYVTEIELAKVKLGQQAKVSIDAYPDKQFDGTVIYISFVAEFTPKNIQKKDDRTKLVFGVKIEIPNPEFTLKPGMPADALLQ